jgi:hypothetical protein
VQDAIKIENAFSAKVRAGEKKDAAAVEHAALVSQCKSIIEGYHPVRNNRTDSRDQQEAQASWTKDLNEAAKKSGVEAMRLFTKSLVAKRDKRYADIEAASERL